MYLYAKNIIRWRWVVVIIALSLVAVAGSGIPLMSNAKDYRIFFGEHNPHLLAFEKMEKTYTRDDNIFFVLAPKNGNVFTQKNLSAVEQLTNSAWQIPYSSRVDSISNYQYTHAQGDDLIVRDLYRDAGSLSEVEILKIREIALSEPLLLNRLISPKAHVTGINVTFQFPGKSETENPEVISYVTQLADQIRSNYPDIEVYVTGLVMLPNAFYTASTNDMRTLMPLALLVVLVVIGVLLREWSSTFTTLWVILLSIITAMGLTGWFGIKLTPVSSNAFTIILTLGVANSIHILVSLLHAMRHGSDKNSAIIESLRINIQPVVLTSLTTMVGFLSLNFSDARPFHDLGNIVSMGIGASLILSLTFLPALIAILPLKQPKPVTNTLEPIDKLAEFVIQKRQILLWGIALVVVILISFIPRNHLRENMVYYFDESIPFRINAEFVSDNLGGIYGINYSISAGEAGGISDPEFLRKLDEFSNWYRSQPEVIHVSSITDTFKRLNKNMHGDDPEYYRLPQERSLAAQYLLLYEMSLPYGLDLNNQVNVDKSATRIFVNTGTLHSDEVINLEERAQAWLNVNMPELRSDGSSTTVMFSHIAAVNIESMITGTSIALIIISAILVVALRSVRVGAISLIPNIIPPAMGFGLWGLIVGEVTVGASIVAAMVLGIVVDDTVHFLSKYLRARNEKQMDTHAAVRYAFHSVGKALWITSLVLVCGFMILAFSTFKMNSHLGILTSIIVVLALIADFLFLPPLLMIIDGEKGKSPAGNKNAAQVASS